jgi:lambda family phage minor tail protein L
MPLSSAVQSLAPGDLVTLFRLDATFVGAGVYTFCQATENDQPIVYGGIAFQPVDVEFTDLSTNAQGQAARPKVRVANTNMIFQGIINEFGDLLGSTLTRIRTFARFLDDQPEADPSAFMGPDIFRIEQKTNENQIFIEWELSSSIDQEGKLLPGRQILRDTCTNRYRYWNADLGAFVYSKATCPYTGTAYFDALGQATTQPNDRCGRRLSDCMKRFGVDQPLPFAGFPGASRVRA